MNNIFDLTAEDILKVPSYNPERLFNSLTIKEDMKRLRSMWHPDKCTHSLADDVFAHLMSLYEIGLEQIEKSMWKGNGELRFVDVTTHKEYKFKYKKSRPIDIGFEYMADSNILYLVDEANEDLYRMSLDAIRGIKYPSDRVKSDMAHQIPIIIHASKTDKGFVVIFKKPTNAVRLQDMIDYATKLPAVHVAWMTSTLCNFMCLLDYNKLVHNYLSPESFWIYPEEHSGIIFEWWYTRKQGEKLVALPVTVLKVLPSSVLDTKLSRAEHDRLMVRNLGLCALGDNSGIGTKLLSDATIPKQVLQWYRVPTPSKTAVLEYQSWENARDGGFGPRKFHKLDITSKDVYGA